jgi:hypothetical protein
MTRLIVEDGGKRRGFKVSDGTLTIGSGEGATLRLAAPGVADVHAEIVVRGGRASLRPRPGVVPPLVGGRPATEEVELQHSVPIRIGSATLHVEYEGEPAAPAGAAPQAAAPRTMAAGRVAERAAGQPMRKRPPAKAASKAKPWLIVGGALIVAGLLVWVAGKVLTQRGDADMEARTFYRRALGHLERNEVDFAEKTLNEIPDESRLSSELKSQVAALREQVQAARAESQLALHNMSGDPYLETQLKRFERDYLQGQPDLPAVRVFLERAQEFKRRWPKHPGVAWVERMEERFRGVVDLTQPPTFEDIAFKVKTLTWADPRDFKQALALLDAFAADAGPEDRAQALALSEQKKEERAAWFKDKMLQARYEYERGKPGMAVEWLRRLIVFTGDEEMANQAASELVLIEDAEALLRGYKSRDEQQFAELAKNPIIAKFIKEKGIT